MEDKNCGCNVKEIGLCGQCQANEKLIEDIQARANVLREALMGPMASKDICSKEQAPDCMMASLISQFEQLRDLMRTLESIRI